MKWNWAWPVGLLAGLLAVGEARAPSDPPPPAAPSEEVRRETTERAPALDLDALADSVYQIEWCWSVDARFVNGVGSRP